MISHVAQLVPVFKIYYAWKTGAEAINNGINICKFFEAKTCSRLIPLLNRTNNFFQARNPQNRQIDFDVLMEYLMRQWVKLKICWNNSHSNVNGWKYFSKDVDERVILKQIALIIWVDKRTLILVPQLNVKETAQDNPHLWLIAGFYWLSVQHFELSCRDARIACP